MIRGTNLLFGTKRLVLAAALIASGLAAATLAQPAQPGHAQATFFTGVPSTDETDGKFLGLAGLGLRTLTNPSKIFLGIPAGQSSFTVEVFDGDLGGLWDNRDPATAPNAVVVYELYTDPTKSGSGGTLIATKTQSDFTDDAWVTMFSGVPDAAARAASGNFFYRLEIKWRDVDQSFAEFNGFKVRANAQVSLNPGQWAFAGAPINIGTDPGFGTARNRYSGDWHWYMYVPTPQTVETTECDADLRTDPVNPGIPPDDDLSDPSVLISPDIRYSLTNPDGTLLTFNLNPSGNTVCQTRTYPGQPAGIYDWHWFGVDAHNLVFIDSLYEVTGTPFTPLPTGAPTPTPVAPTATPTSPPPPPPPGPTDTPTPTPAPPGGGVLNPTTPTPTSTVPASPTVPANPTVPAIPTLRPLNTATPAAATATPEPDEAAGAGEGEFPGKAPGQAPAQAPGQVPVKAPVKAPAQLPVLAEFTDLKSQPKPAVGGGSDSPPPNSLPLKLPRAGLPAGIALATASLAGTLLVAGAALRRSRRD